METLEFLFVSFPTLRDQVSETDLEELFRRWTHEQLIVQVARGPQLFSLTVKGNGRLSVGARRYRDKVRIFLLKTARSSRVALSGEVVQELAGASPALVASSTIKEGARPKKPAAASPASGLRVVGRLLWPRLAKQLNLAGSEEASPDTLLRYYSFASMALIARARDAAEDSESFTIPELALAIGISPRLISACIHAPARHYRRFSIPKAGGKERIISSPRTFLKVIQYWVLDYLLGHLRAHHACHSYQRGRSILSNATPHIGKRFVAAVDIEDYFGSINTRMILRLLVKLKFDERTARMIAALVTFGDALPQGAPTSPHISNLILYEFDKEVSRYARERQINYTRYADDITLSGDDLGTVRSAIAKVEELIGAEGLRVNQKKTRIISRGGQQRVTGVVVNQKAQPPRKLRRKIRAMFHNADGQPKEYRDRVAELRGYISYLSSFPELTSHRSIESYRDSLRQLAD